MIAFLFVFSKSKVQILVAVSCELCDCFAATSIKIMMCITRASWFCDGDSGLDLVFVTLWRRSAGNFCTVKTKPELSCKKLDIPQQFHAVKRWTYENTQTCVSINFIHTMSQHCKTFLKRCLVVEFHCQKRFHNSWPSLPQNGISMGFPSRDDPARYTGCARVHRVYRVHHRPCLHTVQRKHAQYFQLPVVYDANSLFSPTAQFILFSSCIYWLISCWFCQPDWTVFFILFFFLVRHRMTNEVLHKEMLCFNLL